MSCSLSLEIRSSLYSNPTFILKFLQIGKPWLKVRRRMLYPAELCRHTIVGLLRWRSVTRQSPKSCINAGFVARCLRAKSRFFSLFDHPDRWPIFFYFQPIFFSAKMLFASSAALGFSNQNSQYRIAIDTWVLFNSSQYRSPLRRRLFYPLN